MQSKRRQIDRGGSSRRRPAAHLETLEIRQLLSTGSPGLGLYAPADLSLRTAHHGTLQTNNLEGGFGNGARQLSFLDNDGKILTGRDRNGNQWTITVHGPGAVIVTDATPNDGVLDDDIDTIQLVGTSLKNTYVTGTVVGSGEVQTSPVVLFNKLTAASGVKSVILNGFNLTRTVAPTGDALNNTQTGVFLSGGAQVLQFNDVIATIDTSTNDQPVNIVIGSANTALLVRPSVKIRSIYNTVVDSTSTSVPTGPQTSPTVNLVINGQAQKVELVSSTADATIPAGIQYLYPTVGVTGRTAIRAVGLNTLAVAGSAVNVTASRKAVPFSSSTSGLTHLNKATFGGNADGLGLDVRGRIGGLKFNRGLGNPTGVSTAATTLGTPTANFGYPGNRLLGGKIVASSIGHIKAGPANAILSTAQNPGSIQSRRTNSTTYYVRPGNAMTNAAVTSSTDIGKTEIVGNLQNTEIKAGYNAAAAAAGLQGTRGASRIGRYHQRGDMVNSVVSASYIPGGNVYGSSTSTAGDGTITGDLTGNTYNTQTTTALGNVGAGFYARTKQGGYLPPPQAALRVHGVRKA
ncbi:hypothetical protein EP7_005043 [Isosphaeraceae bacterium EP7]